MDYNVEKVKAITNRLVVDIISSLYAFCTSEIEVDSQKDKLIDLVEATAQGRKNIINKNI